MRACTEMWCNQRGQAECRDEAGGSDDVVPVLRRVPADAFSALPFVSMPSPVLLTGCPGTQTHLLFSMLESSQILPFADFDEQDQELLDELSRGPAFFPRTLVDTIPDVSPAETVLPKPMAVRCLLVDVRRQLRAGDGAALAAADTKLRSAFALLVA